MLATESQPRFWRLAVAAAFMTGFHSPTAHGLAAVALPFPTSNSDGTRVAPLACVTSQASSPAPTPFGTRARPVIVAHRGGALEAPENTLAAIRHGVSCGADWQELDVTLSRDDAVIVIHDHSVDRTTSGHGEVADLDLAQLRELSAGRARVTGRGPDLGVASVVERLPTLDEALRVPGAHLIIDLKAYGRCDRLVERVLEEIRKARAWDRVAAASVDPAMLSLVHEREPSLPLVGFASDMAAVERQLKLPLAALGVGAQVASQTLELAPATLPVWTWTVFSVSQAIELRDLGVDGIITDVPAAVVGALRTAGNS